MARIHDAQSSFGPTPVQGVSARELLMMKEGTAKLIRLGPGVTYPEHQHPDRTEYVYVLSGRPRLFDGTEHHDCVPGDFVSFPAKTPHVLANPGSEEVVLLAGAIFHR